MAIKIDLLPEYVPLRRTLKWVISGCVVVLGVTASGLAMYLHKERLAFETLQTNVNNIKTVADKARSVQAEADALRTESQPMKNAIDFVYLASRTGPERAALLHQISQYILPTSMVSTVDISDGKTVKINASVKENRDYWSFLYALRDGSDQQGGVLFAGLPVASGIPGFPEGNRVFVAPPPSATPIQLQYPLSVTATGNLKNPVTVPVDPTGAAAAPAEGAPPEGGTP